MKRTSKKAMVSGILALSMVLAGTGYAYWTDTLNVTTKATTGDLDVTFVDLGTYAQYSGEASGWTIVDGIPVDGYLDAMHYAGGGYNRDVSTNSDNYSAGRGVGYNEITFDAELKGAKAIKKDYGDYTTVNALGSDKIEITINEMYPGYAQAFRADIINQGSIAAKLSALEFTVSNATGNTEDMLGIAVLIKNENETLDAFKLCDQLGLSADEFFTIGGVDFVRLSALSNPAIMDALAGANIMLTADYSYLPGGTENGGADSMDLYIGVAMDSDADGVYTTGSVEADNPNNNKDSASQNKSAKISIDLGWDQFNVDAADAPANILAQQNVAGS